MTEVKKKQWPIPKTVRPKEIVIDGKLYDKCPYRGCEYMVEIKSAHVELNKDNGEYTYYRPRAFASPNDIYGHVKSVHGYVWMHIGKSSGWYPLGRFHSRDEIETFESKKFKDGDGPFESKMLRGDGPFESKKFRDSK